MRKFFAQQLSKMGSDLKSLAPGISESIGNVPPRLRNIGRRVSAPATKTAMAAGRGLNAIGSSRGALIGIGIGAGALGMASEVGPATKDAMLEAAFGDPNADVYFTGRDLTARSLAGAAMGGVGGGILRATAPGDLIATNPGAAVAAGVSATAMGGVGGAFAGGALGYLATGKATKGAVLGGVIGALSGATSSAGSYVSNNSQFFSQSPYSPSASRMIAGNMNATGDIVLGMHNSRRGY